MTSLGKRFNNVLVELAIIREALEGSSRYPPCCLTLHGNGMMSCDIKGPLPKEQFLRECETCVERIKSFFDRTRES